MSSPGPCGRRITPLKYSQSFALRSKRLDSVHVRSPRLSLNTMTALAASPALRLPLEAPPRRLRWSVIISVLLHLGLLVAAILAARQRHTLPEPVPPSPVAMVFEGGGAKTPPSIANPAPVSPNQPASPKPQPSTPATPSAQPATPPTPRVQPTPQPQPQKPPEKAPPAETTPPKPLTTEAPPPEPQAVTPPKPSATEAPPPKTPPVTPPTPPAQQAPPREQTPPPVQAPPQPKPPPSPPQEVGPPPRPVPSENAPVVTAPAEQAPAPRAVPLPPPPPAPVPVPETAPRPAPSRPREAARAAPMRPSLAFPAPMNLSLGSPAAEAPAEPPSPKPSAGVMDLSFAANVGGGDITQLHPNGKGDDVGADWLNEVSAWWIRHRFYPKDAAQLQQQGDVILRLKVAQSGHVQAVNVVQGSGSPFLDMGALTVFRNANLPRLPSDVRDPDVTLEFTIHYEILR